MALARAYRQEDRFSAARRTLEDVLGLPSGAEADRIRARQALVELFLDSGDLLAAADACRPLIETGRPSAVARRLAGVVAYRAGDLGTAVSELGEATRLAPEDPGAHAALGLAFLQAGRLEEAALSLEEAERLDPDSQTAVSNLAKVYDRLGRPEQAEQALVRYRSLYERKSVRQKTGPLRARAVEAYNAGRLEEALAGFREVLRLAPRDPQAMTQAGSVLLALERLDEAQASLEESLRIQPENDYSLTELARVRALRQDLPAALELLQRAVRANPTAPEPHYFLAGIYLSQGRREDFQRERKAYLELRGNAPADTLRPLPEGETP